MKIKYTKGIFTKKKKYLRKTQNLAIDRKMLLEIVINKNHDFLIPHMFIISGGLGEKITP